MENWVIVYYNLQLGSFCLSEAGSGSDAFALETAAVRDGDNFVINGEKLWITNSGEAGLLLVFANINRPDSNVPVSRPSLSVSLRSVLSDLN